MAAIVTRARSALGTGPGGPLDTARRRPRALAHGPLPRLAGRERASRSRPTTTRGAGRWMSRARSGSRSGTTSASARSGRPAPPSPTPRMPGARWFPDALINYAEHALRMPDRSPDDVVIVARSQTREPVELTAAALRDAVARCRAGLMRQGVGRGDRVAAYVPNIPEAVIGLLATASLGSHLVVLRARVRDPGRRRPVRPGRADGAAGGRRLPVRRQGDRPVGADRRDPRRPAQPPVDRRRALSPLRARGRRGRPGGRRVVGAARRARRRSPSTPSRSTTRCTCCSRRGPPGCPSRSSTATAASSSSTSRRSRSTRTSGRPTGSAGSRRPAG